ncbi:MAG: phosphoenolpyruvate carboxylase [Cellvibrionaceae bacterium]|jgi:phosphoenolpyruvate carboxylase
MSELPATLRDNVRLLGGLLGETLRKYQGDDLFDKVEAIRTLSKQLSEADASDYQPLLDQLVALDDEDVLSIARAFNQFLNLANIADQEYFVSAEATNVDRLQQWLLAHLPEQGEAAVAQLIQQVQVHLVLTAHPTEVTRRTLIHKYEAISHYLSERSRSDLLHYESNIHQGRLRRLIEEVWATDEIRSDRPSAVDEAKWGFVTVEDNLWQALPDFLRHLDRLSRQHLNQPLPLDCAPMQFYSWMGGDRDGNPNVTHDVTEEVILLGRWKAAELYLGDIRSLASDLSMASASEELLITLGRASSTPYRDLLHNLRHRLQATLSWTHDRLTDATLSVPAEVIQSREDLLQPLMLCYRSLLVNNQHSIANGPLSDVIRRVHAFGISLLPLDIRQDSERHVQLLDELTQYLDIGSYHDWDETQRQTFLLEQLNSRRPLLPAHWPVSDESAEVIATCRVIASQARETLSHYVISMARQASDVLAVALILKETGIRWSMPITPLFETLDDLNRAPEVMTSLWRLDWYRQYSQRNQTVMIGYSDSAKDAGKLAATWAQYRAQEQLVELAEQNDIELVLFHGRGGTIGRGGGPVEKAMASQPPGSIKGHIRVTEQGEMIRYKFGMPRVAFTSFSAYFTAVLNATLKPAAPPKAEWRALMDKMSTASLHAYRNVVREDQRFVPYFRSLTPEQELGKLALGSRPAKRKASGGIESLRAIPWVFAWMQVRLNLPAWLGVQQALQMAKAEEPQTLIAMAQDWPFFASFIDLVEMVVGKVDLVICTHYEQQLVDKSLHGLGQQLRQDLQQLTELLNELKHQQQLLAQEPLLKQALEVRKPYVDPLNYLQAELLKRERRGGSANSQASEQALKVTMAGISAGMRNTG